MLNDGGVALGSLSGGEGLSQGRGAIAVPKLAGDDSLMSTHVATEGRPPLRRLLPLFMEEPLADRPHCNPARRYCPVPT